VPDSMESPREPVWSHLLSVSGFSEEFLRPPTGRRGRLRRCPPPADGHRLAALPFSTRRSSPTRQRGSGQFQADRFRSIQSPMGAITGSRELVGRLLAPYGVYDTDRSSAKSPPIVARSTASSASCRRSCAIRSRTRSDRHRLSRLDHATRFLFGSSRSVSSDVPA
jgi:hypothetical protein